MNNIIYALKTSWKASPSRVILEFIVRLLYRLYNVYHTVFLLGYVFNAIENDGNVYYLFLLVGISIILMVAYDYLAAWYYNAYKPYVDQDVFREYNMLIYKKAAEVDLECYENPEFYNKYTKTLNEMAYRFESVLSDAVETAVDILMNSYLFAVIFQLDVFAVAICFVPLFIKYIIGKKLNTERFKLFTDNVEHNRRKDYIKRTVYLKDYSKEIRTSNIFSLLNEKFKTASYEIMRNIQKYGVKIAVLDFFNISLVVIFTYFIAILYASYRALVAQTLSIGDYIILVNAVSRLSALLVGFVDKILRFNENSKYISNIRDFIDLKSKMPSGKDHISGNLPIRIEFKNVYYTYPGQVKPCLDNINLSVGAGEKIAIVGLNGAGKTTLVKLLMRLYDVSEGEILINGTNIKDYDKNEYRAIFSTVFQDFRIFAATVAENVLLDTVGKKDNEIDDALSNSGIYQTLIEKCGEHFRDKVLTKEFDNEGLVLSGGEFQKIAIARAFIKRGGVAVLDEPSSALDPIAEKEMFEKLLSACKDKTVIFISHRLSAAALADRIYVMDNGRIAEHGTHEQLMGLKGIYYKMYVKQNKRFSNSGDSVDEEEQFSLVE